MSAIEVSADLVRETRHFAFIDEKLTPQKVRQRGGIAGACSTGPGMSLKRRFERRLRDAAGIVRDRGRGDAAITSRSVIFAETGRDESIDILIVEAPTLLDHRSRQRRQRGEFAVLRQTALTNGLDIRRIDAFLQRQRGMERDRPAHALVTASVSRTICTCASVKLPPCTFPNSRQGCRSEPEKSPWRRQCSGSYQTPTAIAAAPASNLRGRIPMCEPEILSCDSAFIDVRVGHVRMHDDPAAIYLGAPLLAGAPINPRFSPNDFPSKVILRPLPEPRCRVWRRYAARSAPAAP